MERPPSPDCRLEACRRSLVAGDLRSLRAQLEALSRDHPWEDWAKRSLSGLTRLDGQEIIWGFLTFSLVLITYSLSL